MKNDIVQKFRQYLILEGDSPEIFMKNCLDKIKAKLDPIFDDSVKKMKDFKNFNLQKQNDAQVDRYSHTDNSLKYKFTDEENTLYILTITIDLENALNDKPEQDYKTSNIKKAKVTFQKYGDDKDGKFVVINELMPRTVDPEEIDGDFLIKLKMDLDKGKTETEEDNEEEFKIETGDEMPEEESNNEQTPPSQSGNGPAAGAQAPPPPKQGAAPAQSPLSK